MFCHDQTFTLFSNLGDADTFCINNGNGPSHISCYLHAMVCVREQAVA